jgi:hypothetical protein
MSNLQQMQQSQSQALPQTQPTQTQPPYRPNSLFNPMQSMRGFDIMGLPQGQPSQSGSISGPSSVNIPTRMMPQAPQQAGAPTPSSVSPVKPGGANTAFADPASSYSMAFATSQNPQPAGGSVPQQQQQPPQPAQQRHPLNEVKERIFSIELLINTLEQNLDRMKSNPDMLPDAEFRSKYTHHLNDLKAKKEVHARLQGILQNSMQANP